MADLIDQLRERAERAERERDEARDTLRALRHGLGQDDGPRRAAIAEADRAIASWGAQVPGPLADLHLSRDAWRDRALAAEWERDEARRALDGLAEAVERGLCAWALTGDLARDVLHLRQTADRAIDERDEARAECDAVREALLTVREDGETCAAAVARLLEESESQLVALRRQGAEVSEARRELDAAVQRAERAERRLAFTEEWYGCRWERLRDLIRGTHYEEIACQIMANGTPHQDETGEVVYEPPSYESQLNAQRHRASAAEERARRAEAEAARLREVVDAARALAAWDWLWLLREDCEHSDDVRVDAKRLDAALARLDGGA